MTLPSTGQEAIKSKPYSESHNSCDQERKSHRQGHTEQRWVLHIKQTRENTKHLLRVAISVVSSAGDMVIHVSIYMDVYIHASMHVYVPSTVLGF